MEPKLTRRGIKYATTAKNARETRLVKKFSIMRGLRTATKDVSSQPDEIQLPKSKADLFLKVKSKERHQ